jgi:hypothetical protein
MQESLFFCEQRHFNAYILTLQDEKFEEFCGRGSVVNVVFKRKSLFKNLKYHLHDPKQIFEFVQCGTQPCNLVR